MALRYALAIGCFKTKDDGSKVFFPWGPGAVGYVVPSDEEFERLLERMSAWLGFALPLAIFFAILLMLAFDTHFGKLVIGALVSLAWIGTFAIWVRIQCGSLEPTDEKLSVEEWAAIAARESSSFVLYLSMIMGMVFFAGSMYVIALWTEGTVGMLLIDLYWVFVAVTRARILREKNRLASCSVQHSD